MMKNRLPYLITTAILSSVNLMSMQVIQNRYDKLAREHTDLGGSRAGAIYLGKTIRNPDCKERLPLSQLIPALREEADSINELEITFKTDVTNIKNALSLIFGSHEITTLQDAHDVLPDGASYFCSDLKGMTRKNPEGFTLDSTPLLKERYLQSIAPLYKFIAMKALL